MAKILNDERIVEYSCEIKVRVVKLTEALEVTTGTLAEIMGFQHVVL